MDLWPDVSELSPDERFDTGFVQSNGRPAQVFSSYRAATVLRHFRWMRESGIDGVFVQRFAVGLRNPKSRRFTDTVLEHCRAGAREHGRVYAVMYDLSGMASGTLDSVAADWRELRDHRGLTADPGYLHHRGRPLVAVWGVGFNDRRGYGLSDCRALVEVLKRDGAAVMLGVPARWREGTRDALGDPARLETFALADVISPWTVGRFHDDASLSVYLKDVVAGDLAWCRERDIAFLPVAFPGFSWHNLKGDPSDAIPRREGRFLWSQFAAYRTAGLDAAYVAMFDEVDEGTAIFKCVDDPPVGQGNAFVGFTGVPSDHYLWLTGQGRRLLRGEIPVEPELPRREPPAH